VRAIRARSSQNKFAALPPEGDTYQMTDADRASRTVGRSSLE